MEDYEYYHAQGEEDPVDPHHARLPRFHFHSLKKAIQKKHYSREELETLLATALFNLRQRDFRDFLASN